jgi:hypothetical protein
MRTITVTTRRIIGRLWLVKLAERGYGGTKRVLYWSEGDQRQEIIARVARVLRDEMREAGQ